MSIDLDAYFRRIGYDGPRAPSLATLRALHEAHPRAMPFENLDPLLGRKVTLDAAALNAKLLHGGRGGYCFEHNVLFAGVLRAMGFRLRELLARVRWNVPEGRAMPRTHMVLLIALGGQEVIADVGFGGNTLTAPLVLSAGLEQQTPHEPARLTERSGWWTVEVKVRGAWTAAYTFDLSEQLAADLEISNWFTATHPQSPFVGQLYVARTDVGMRHALANNTLATHVVNGDTERRTLTTAPELRDALTDVFRIALPRGRALDEVLGRLAAAR